MDYENIPFKSYCWCIGTTSFRTDKLNLKIEKQLDLLDSFRSIKGNSDANWNEALQEKYYDYMKENNFITGNAPRKAKDARQKTSGLVEIGLIDKQRRLTKAGLHLLNLSRSGNFESDNDFQISSDSYVYFKQLIKTSVDIDGGVVRPFIVLAYILSKVNYLTLDEYAYLLPLCIDENSLQSIIKAIPKVRNKSATIDDLIIDTLMSMENYKKALNLLLSIDNVDEDLICTIGINRKSRSYDKPYFQLYKLIEEIIIQDKETSIAPLFKATKSIKGAPGTMWRKFLFSGFSEASIEKDPWNCLQKNALLSATTLNELKTKFFHYMHLFKARATLKDYLDLNRRYFKITDTVLFEDVKVEFDIIPKYFFKDISEQLLDIAFKKTQRLNDNCKLEEISSILSYKDKSLFDGIEKDYDIKVTNSEEAVRLINDQRYNRFNELIDAKFTDQELISLLDMFESRSDLKISDKVTDNADIPTIFEYILGIIWYKISNRQGDILKYMNLSLDADLLPKTHAAGGDADIVYYYPETSNYPEHYLLLEATLCYDSNQRRMEMEPVSRHLGEHLLKTGNLNSYCIFTSTYLQPNVISDFRHRKTYPYYSNDGKNCVDGLKIIPIETSALKSIISSRKKYPEIYSVLEAAHNSNENLPAPNWYEVLKTELSS